MAKATAKGVYFRLAEIDWLLMYNSCMRRYLLRDRVVRLLGPAFVAAVAYVDPGNFAANFSAGAKYGYLLLWVLVLANAMAAIVQYLSAKVGLVTGMSLPEIVAKRLSRWPRICYWLQAEMVAVATDIAEIVGGAIALNLLFGLPLLPGGVVTGVVSMVMLRLYSSRRQHYFERMIVTMLLVIPIGFLVGLILHPPSMGQIAGGLVPAFDGRDTLLLATAMIGATIMPHVIYLHSALARDRHGQIVPSRMKEYLRATKIDVGLAMAVAGTVNVSMLLLAAVVLRERNIETLQDVYMGLQQAVNPQVAVLFAVGLLLAGLASTSVGSQAGAAIMAGLLEKRIPTYIRRVVTIIPALFLLVLGYDPTQLLIISQVALSFGVPFALIPLVLVTKSDRIMRVYKNSKVITVILTLITAVIVTLNVILLAMTLVPR